MYHGWPPEVDCAWVLNPDLDQCIDHDPDIDLDQYRDSDPDRDRDKDQAQNRLYFNFLLCIMVDHLSTNVLEY